jgi:hypothetical protein
MTFSDLGEGAAYWEGEPLPPMRLPGGLNPNGADTFLVIRNLGGELKSEVTKNLASLFYHHGQPATSVIVIDMNGLVRRVLARLQDAEAQD